MTRIVFFSEDPTRVLKTKLLGNLSTDGVCTMGHAPTGGVPDAVQLGVPSV